MQLEQVIKRLQADYGLKRRGDYLREGKCPSCGKKELFISATEPHHLKCGRESKCNWGSKTRELYPELWKPLHALYPPTKNDPHATAKAYLHSRGLDAALFAAEFVQGQRYEREAVREPKGTETVRFFLNAEKSVYWERFIQVIEMPDKPKKAHFNGSYKGLWWQPKHFEPKSGQQVFLVEGILDALSLIQSGFSAVSLMSSNNWPEKAIQAYLGKGIHWVVALDNDQAGQRYTKALVRKLRALNEQAEACLAPDREKCDWNDLLKACGGVISRDKLKKWFHTGRLLTAISPTRKALEIVDYTNKHRFTFEFDNQLYAAKYSDKDEDNPIQLENIANCKPEFLYFQKDALSGESSYYLRVTRPAGEHQRPQIYKDVFTSSALAAAPKFKDRLMDVGAGLMFTGNTKQLEQYQNTYWFPPGEPLSEVQTINFLGYSTELNGWLFPKHAVFDGRLYRVNEDDFFDLPDGRQVKTTFRQDTVVIGDPLEAHRPDLWLDDYKTAYGAKGLAILAYWAGSFLVQQIRKEQDSYPFLELCGQPGTGKTSVLTFLWKLTGREGYEGLDLAKATHSNRWRSFAQLANMPLVTIEGDPSKNESGHQRRTFDLNEAKPLYNGRGMRGTSPKNTGIETHEPPFRGAFVIAQNTPVDAEPATMERIIQVYWDKSHFSSQGYHAAQRLQRLDMEQINGFMTACITQEKGLLTVYKAHYQAIFERLESRVDLTNQRIRHNHAQIMAMAHALQETGILGGLLASDLVSLDNYLTQCCVERHQCLEADTPLVAEFWDMYHFLEDESGHRVNHSSDQTRIAISLLDFVQILAENKLKPLDLTQLRRELKQSRRYKFIDANCATFSKIKGKTVKCFVFANTAGPGQAMAA
ncbi:toprim domain-containing protein [Thiolinea disciformis]|uniref:toprim domain-containing protein n=1 Tax=Thiolinea disciformis TaxID=125614 RepID=UPI00037A371F|nr:toprim domain-containing protein [Thiolinea disciformis]